MVGEVVVDLFQPKLMSRIVNTVVASGEMDGVMRTILMTSLEMILLVAVGGFCGIMCCYTASVALLTKICFMVSRISSCIIKSRC